MHFLGRTFEEPAASSKKESVACEDCARMSLVARHVVADVTTRVTRSEKTFDFQTSDLQT